MKKYFPVAVISLGSIGLLFCLLQIGVFLWSGDWISLATLIGKVSPQSLQSGWLADPKYLIGLHWVITSPFLGLILLGTSMLILRAIGDDRWNKL